MKPKNFNLNIKNDETWLTPPSLLKKLGPFDLDPCASNPRPWDSAKKHYSLPLDGLALPWEGRVFLNPPYGKKTFLWLEKLSTHPGGGIALIFARTETIGFFNTVWNKANSILFIKGRIKFLSIDGLERGAANAPSCLISYTKSDSFKLKCSNIDGKLIYL